MYSFKMHFILRQGTKNCMLESFDTACVTKWCRIDDLLMFVCAQFWPGLPIPTGWQVNGLRVGSIQSPSFQRLFFFFEGHNNQRQRTRVNPNDIPGHFSVPGACCALPLLWFFFWHSITQHFYIMNDKIRFRALATYNLSPMISSW